MERVSVIMPVRNAEPFLKECLESICDQSYQNWELIAVNDHSTDGTLSILHNYSKMDKRIHVLENTGEGIIDALKTGYKQSTGRLITRMDADDIMPLNKLELMAAEVSDGNVVTGKVEYISQTELGEGFKKYEHWLNELIDNNTHWDEVYKECVIPSPCWMMTKQTFDSIGGFAESVYPEDYDLVFRMYRNGIKVVGLDEVLHIWRDHQTRTSRNDNNYSDNSFLQLKLKYFLEADHDPNKKLAIWGAGKKGKRAAKYLLERSIVFDWITDNQEKIGKDIHGIEPISSAEALKSNEERQIIVLVANPEEQAEIGSNWEDNSNLQPFWFC